MNRKSQITLIMIIVIVLVVGAGFLIYFNAYKTKNLAGLITSSEELDSMKLYLTQCLYNTGEKGVFNLSQHGGFYNQPPHHTIVGNFTIANYYDSGSVTVPSLGELEGQLERYIDDHLFDCVNFSYYEDKGYSIKHGSISSKATIFEDYVSLTMKLPVKAEKNHVVHNFEEYETELGIRYGHVYDIASKITLEIAKRPEYRPLSFLLSFDVLPNVVPYNENVDVYVIRDPDSNKMGEEEYKFAFTAVFG